MKKNKKKKRLEFLYFLVSPERTLHTPIPLFPLVSSKGRNNFLILDSSGMLFNEFLVSSYI